MENAFARFHAVLVAVPIPLRSGRIQYASRDLADYSCQTIQNNFRMLWCYAQFRSAEHFNGDKNFAIRKIQRDVIRQSDGAAFEISFSKTNIQGIGFRIICDSHRSCPSWK